MIRPCKGSTWTQKVREGFRSDCLDVLAPDGVHTHLHGTWTGWDAGRLVITLSAPFREHTMGSQVIIDPCVQLWRPAERKFVYRPRHHFAQLSVDLQHWLMENPAWDADVPVVPGSWRHQ